MLVKWKENLRPSAWARGGRMLMKIIKEANIGENIWIWRDHNYFEGKVKRTKLGSKKKTFKDCNFKIPTDCFHICSSSCICKCDWKELNKQSNSKRKHVILYRRKHYSLLIENRKKEWWNCQILYWTVAMQYTIPTIHTHIHNRLL